MSDITIGNATGPASPPLEPPAVTPETTLSPGQWGMLAFLLSEVTFFSTLIVVYVSFLGRDTEGPTPADTLSLFLVSCTTVLLLSSSLTIHFAERALRRGDQQIFCVLWGLTIGLGVAFLVGTGYEWNELIVRHQLTLNRNLFGTTYYTLVGFHGLHVSAGVLVMAIVFGLALFRQVSEEHHGGVELISWYWHFVDVVWIAVFTVVYLWGR